MQREHGAALSQALQGTVFKTGIVVLSCLALDVSSCSSASTSPGTAIRNRKQ